MISGNLLRQASFRGREQDGVEYKQESDGGASWIGNINQNWTQEATGQFLSGHPDGFRVRFLVVNSGGARTERQIIRYSLNLGAWTSFGPLTSSVMQVTNSAWLTHGANTTDFVGRLGSGAWFVDNEAQVDEAANTPWHNWPDSRQSETEVSMKILGDTVSAGDQIRLRLYRFTLGGGTSPFQVYTSTPTITVAKTTFLPGAEGVFNCRFDAENRTRTFAAEQRLALFDAESRAHRFGPENRIAYFPAEGREEKV